MLINQCIEKGVFPDQLKVARVSAIFKKGEKNLFSNYRPVSILPALSKIFERILHDQLTHYFTSNDLFYGSQYGFRQYHSTELASLEFVDTVMQNLENRKPYISLFMDLSKAFDCLNHAIPQEKLHYYGIRDNSLKLLVNYLTNRKQYVELTANITYTNSSTTPESNDRNPYNESSSENIGKIKSGLGSINIGVPQGSILGPLLFLIYINDFSECSSFFTSILYADDSTFSSSIENNDPNNDFNNRINSEISKVCNWLEANRLSLNVSKTKFMLFNRTLTDIELVINDVKLEQVNTFNFLGLTINNTLDWSSHLSNIN